MLALVEQSKDPSDVFDCKAGFASNRDIVVSPLFHTPDVVQQVDRTVLAPREVLDETHHQAVLSVGLHHESRNYELAEGLIRFEPALTAYEVVPQAVRPIPTGHSDRLLEADVGDI